MTNQHDRRLWQERVGDPTRYKITPADCWEWLGQISDRGYGRLRIKAAARGAQEKTRASKVTDEYGGEEFIPDPMTCKQCHRKGGLLELVLGCRRLPSACAFHEMFYKDAGEKVTDE